MDYGYILRLQHFIDSILLRTIQIGEMHGCEGECLCRLMRIEQVAEVAQTSFGPYHTVESLKHRLITCLVEEQLNAYILSPLHINELAVVRHRHHHTVAIDITDGACEIEVFDL